MLAQKPKTKPQAAAAIKKVPVQNNSSSINNQQRHEISIQEQRQEAPKQRDQKLIQRSSSSQQIQQQRGREEETKQQARGGSQPAHLGGRQEQQQQQVNRTSSKDNSLNQRRVSEDGQENFVGQILAKAAQLNGKVQTRMRDYKHSSEITRRLELLADVLKGVEHSSMKNIALFSNQREVDNTLDEIERQVDKYLNVNAVKRKFIGSATRHKITNLLFSLSFQIRLIDAVYVNPPVFERQNSSFSGVNIRMEQRTTEEQRNMETLIRQRLERLDAELERIKLKGAEADKLRLQQGIIEDRLKKSKKKRSERAAKRKSKYQDDGMISKDNEVDTQAQRQLAGQMCMQADAHYFGFAPNANNREALRLYEESENYMNSKAMLALGSIYEKGLINEKSERGGITNMGALEKTSGEPDYQKAYEYYDQAAQTAEEPYGLYKLGQFMEQGIYEKGHRGKPILNFAAGFYKKAAQHEQGCREALYKLGEFYQKGLVLEKNIQYAIRKYDESQAEGYVLSMNALGTVFYNEFADYNQAAEMFKKASEKGCTRSLNNLGICYEFGRGVPKDLDQAFLLYKEAAEKGYLEGMLNLACLYFHNAKETKSQDKFKEAAKWFHTIALNEPSMPEPYFYLGQLHEFGNGQTKDLKSAFQYYRKGAKLDHIESLVKCGDFLFSGRGMPSFNTGKQASIVQRRDKFEALKCYKKASDLGNSRGMNNCGLMLESGFEGMPSDLEKASQLYKQAHKLGNLDATINLAFYYLNKPELENSLNSAKALLKYAYRNGKVDAIDYLLQFDFIAGKEELLTEIVHEDEQGVDIEMRAMAQIDAVPIGHKSMSSARPVYPSQTQEETNTPTTVQAKQFAQFMRGSNPDALKREKQI